jgi:hypothetical protein
MGRKGVAATWPKGRKSWRKRKSTHEMSACTEYGHLERRGTRGRRTPEFDAGHGHWPASSPPGRLSGTRERMGEASSSSWPSRTAAATVAAAAYDYERDPRWAEYRASSAVPPHLFTDPYVRSHLQHKFYRRFVVRTFTPTPTPHHHSSRPSAPSSSL